MSSDLVSVIIPCFRQAHFLPYAIQSCLRQSYPHIEILIVDDGSPDNVNAVIQKFSHATNIRLIEQPNAGLSAARNAGLQKSRGELVQLLDADDVLGKNVIESQVAFLKQNASVSLAVCRNRLFERIGSEGHPRPTGIWRLYHNLLDIHLCYFNIAPPHAFLAKREVVEENGLFDTSLNACEDYDYWIRAASKGYIPYYNPAGIVYYRKHAESMSANIEKQVLHDAILHHRLASIMETFPNYSSAHRVTCLLAFAAGALNSVCRLERRKEITQALLTLVAEKLADVLRLSSGPKFLYHPIAILNYLRCELYLRQVHEKQEYIGGDLPAAISQMLTTISGRHPKSRQFQYLIGNLPRNLGDYRWEYKQSVQYAIRWMWRPFIRNPKPRDACITI